MYEVDIDGQMWVRYRSHFRPQYTAKLLKLEMGPSCSILDAFGLPPLGNNGNSEIQPTNQHNLHSESFRKPPKRLRVDLTFKSYDGKLSPSHQIAGLTLRPAYPKTRTLTTGMTNSMQEFWTTGGVADK
ncbi:hypothetical protein ACTXT7_002695 [Hymenolepis weldensis]